MKWSLAVIARNNEEVIGQTLDSVKMFCDEIIVVDTGSVDGTISVAKEHGATVYEFEWVDDFAKARNHAFSLCTGDWIMWLDTGDVIPEESQRAWAELKKGTVINAPDSDVEMIVAPLNRGVDENGIVVFSLPNPRLLRSKSNPKWVHAVHEYVTTDNSISWWFPDGLVVDPFGYSQSVTDRNIRILERLLTENPSDPRSRFYYANELRDLERWDEAIVAYQDFMALGHYSWEFYEALLSSANVYRRIEKPREAAEVLLQAVYYNPTRAEAFCALGEMYYDEGQYERAMPFYRAVLGMQRPVDGSFVLDLCYGHLPLERLGFCLLNLGRDDQAVIALKEAVKKANPYVAGRLEELIAKLENAMNGNDFSKAPFPEVGEATAQ
jgi:glycosyltransferase involved in cell wall biosynthesis